MICEMISVPAHVKFIAGKEVSFNFKCKYLKSFSIYCVLLKQKKKTGRKIWVKFFMDLVLNDNVTVSE